MVCLLCWASAAESNMMSSGHASEAEHHVFLPGHHLTLSTTFISNSSPWFSYLFPEVCDPSCCHKLNSCSLRKKRSLSGFYFLYVDGAERDMRWKASQELQNIVAFHYGANAGQDAWYFISLHHVLCESVASLVRSLLYLPWCIWQTPQSLYISSIIVIFTSWNHFIHLRGHVNNVITHLLKSDPR